MTINRLQKCFKIRRFYSYLYVLNIPFRSVISRIPTEMGIQPKPLLDKGECGHSFRAIFFVFCCTEARLLIATQLICVIMFGSLEVSVLVSRENLAVFLLKWHVKFCIVITARMHGRTWFQNNIAVINLMSYMAINFTIQSELFFVRKVMEQFLFST